MASKAAILKIGFNHFVFDFGFLEISAEMVSKTTDSLNAGALKCFKLSDNLMSAL